MQDITQEVLNALKRLRRELARRGNRGRKRGRGRPKKGHQKKSGVTLKDKAHFIFKHRYLIVKRRENMTDAEFKDLTTMLTYLPELKTLRAFMDKIFDLFRADQTRQQAGCRRSALVRNESYQAIPELAKVLGMLESEKFDKMMTFLYSEAAKKIRTNNHVERANRKLRYFEKVRYKWRRRRSIVRFLLLATSRWWREHSRHPERNGQDHAKVTRKQVNSSADPTYVLSG
jgi:hypothetical protein